MNLFSKNYQHFIFNITVRKAPNQVEDKSNKRTTNKFKQNKSEPSLKNIHINI